MEWSNLITDPYERKARLYPALLLISPMVASGMTVFSDNIVTLQSLGFAALGPPSAFFLAQIARDFGKQCEKKLYSSWGGMPSVTILRHRNEQLTAITKDRYHRTLSRLLNTIAPTLEDERTDPDGADKIYLAWSDYLRTNTRDKKFDLLHKENISYGYRRNVCGLRLVGIVASVAGSFISAIRLYQVYTSDDQLDMASTVTGTYSFVLLIFWLFYFTGEWVRVPAECYAQRLVESLDVLYPRQTNN